MNIEEIREYCLQKKGVSEGFPFGEDTLVFKVSSKMFCLANLEGDLNLSLKNTPLKNLELRELFPSIRQGYHMNKLHWNTVEINGSLPDALIRRLIDESYELVVKGLTGKQKEELDKI